MPIDGVWWIQHKQWWITGRRGFIMFLLFWLAQLWNWAFKLRIQSFFCKTTLHDLIPMHYLYAKRSTYGQQYTTQVYSTIEPLKNKHSSCLIVMFTAPNISESLLCVTLKVQTLLLELTWGLFMELSTLTQIMKLILVFPIDLTFSIFKI